MANYNTLKTAVADVIKTNGNKEITGLLLQQTLLAIINSLGSQYQFAGKAVEGTTPGTVDTKVAYLAGPGTYANFGDAVIPAQHIGILYGSGSTWNVSTIKVSPIAVQTIIDDIIQLYDGSTPVYPRTKAKAVFFDNDTTKTLDQQFSQLEQNLESLSGSTTDISQDLTLYAESSIINASGGVVSSSSGYSVYKYNITSENRSLALKYLISTGGVNISLVYGYKQDGTPLKRYCLASDAGQYSGVIPLFAEPENLDYILFQKSSSGYKFEIDELVLSDLLKAEFSLYVKKETVVAEFQETPDNEHIPTEKLVYDATRTGKFWEKVDITSQLQLYQDNGFFTAQGVFVSNANYAVYKLAINNLNKSIIDFVISISGTNMPVLFAYRADDTRIGVLFTAPSTGNYEYYFDGNTIDGVSYLLINKYKTKDITPLLYQITQISRSLLAGQYDNLAIETQINVLPGATGSQSLLSILKAMMDGDGYSPSKNNRYVLNLESGEYNLDSSGLGIADKGIFLMPYVTIVGKGRGITKLVFRYSGSDDNIMSRFSTLNTPYSCTIKNLSIIAKNIRYAIHSDGPMTGGPSADNANIVYENVELIHEGFDSGLTPTYKIPNAWGGGSYSGGHLVFKNCKFVAYESAAFGNHDRTTVTSPSVFEFENCEFISFATVNQLMGINNCCVWLNSWGSNIKIPVSFRNCRFNKWVTLFAADSYNAQAKIDYDVLFDNEPMVAMNTLNDTDKEHHYSTGSAFWLKFTTAMSKGTPIMQTSVNYGIAFDGNDIGRCVGILMNDVAAGDVGCVQPKGYVPTLLTLGTDFNMGTKIGWNGSAWVNDSTKPLLVVINNFFSKIID